MSNQPAIIVCGGGGCRCNCGYRCGGPGQCKDPDCLTKREGHFVRDCEHDFTGECVDQGGGLCSTVCQKCGMSSFSHDMRCGP